MKVICACLPALFESSSSMSRCWLLLHILKTLFHWMCTSHSQHLVFSPKSYFGHMKGLQSFSLKLHFLFQYVPFIILICCISIMPFLLPFVISAKLICLYLFEKNWQVPNTIEFADWISRTKQKQIRVTG